MDEMAEGGDNNTIEITEINKFMAPVHLLSLPFHNLLKMSPPSPLSAIPATRRRRDSGVVQPSLEDGVNVVDVPIRGAAGGNFKELEDEAVSSIITMMRGEAVVVRVVEDDLAGKITTSRSATVMLPSISSLTGRCWRRLISTAWLS